MTKPDYNKYDHWFAAKCLPIIHDKIAVASKHLKKYRRNARSKPTIDSLYFAGFTMDNCIWAALTIAYQLVESEDAPLHVRRSALLNIALNASNNVGLHQEIAPAVIQEILTQDDDNALSWMELVKLVEALLIQQHTHLFELDKIDFNEILARLCLKIGLEPPSLRNDEEVFECIDSIKEEIRNQLEEMPDFEN